MKIKITTLALIAISIMSCNSSKNTNSTATESMKDGAIENKQWTLAVLEGIEVHKLNESDQDIHFTLNPKDNRVNGFSGCNTFMGTYTLEKGNRIKFSKMASTRRACPEADINESEVLNIFELADNFTLKDGKLMLNVAKRAPLAVFKKSDMKGEPITEKYWKLKNLEGQDIKMADNQEREIYFTLKTNENRVTGFAGCNTFTGEYKLEKGNRIRFSKMATTLMMCPDVDVNESEFLKVFELADNYTINGDVLSLNVGRRAPLAVFEAIYMN